jgi:AraC family transcriptional regulator of adaptative response/methylated-DNA-[protein]-cysteine methyltransferase
MTMMLELINHKTATIDDPRWERVVTRDRSADGEFWYSVATTGVYCRPSCPSRRPNPNNAVLHDTLEAAKATGFRACKRCNPDGASPDSENAILIEKACRLIEQSDESLPLAKLAEAVDLSPGYFHRLFKAKMGITPKNYAAARRASRVREQLLNGHSVTESIYDAGFNSSGRFYEKSTGMLGMTPTHFRKGGANEEIRFAIGQCSLGAILVASSAKGVAAILIGDEPDKLARDLQDRFPNARLLGADRGYEGLVAPSALSRRRASASICRSISGEPRFNSASGRRCGASPLERLRPTAKLPLGSVRPRRCERWQQPARPTRSP